MAIFTLSLSDTATISDAAIPARVNDLAKSDTLTVADTLTLVPGLGWTDTLDPVSRFCESNSLVRTAADRLILADLFLISFPWPLDPRNPQIPDVDGSDQPFGYGFEPTFPEFYEVAPVVAPSSTFQKRGTDRLILADAFVIQGGAPGNCTTI